MKKKFILLMLVILFSNTIYSHDQLVHQHIVRQAWQLLVLSYPELANSEMAQYIGTNETSNGSSELSWGASKVVSGAWLEDEYDVVYHYGIAEIPNFNQTLTPELVQIFVMNAETKRAAFSSISHFWNADGGANSETVLSDYASGIYWSYSAPNAMQKMYKYLNGNYDNRYLLSSANMFSSCSDIGYGWDFYMGNLFDLYFNEIQANAVRYLDINLDWVSTTCPQFYLNKGEVYEIFGRMCHLLGDMSVPAHVHCTSHAGTSGMYCDLYENNVQNFTLHTAQAIYNNGGRYIDPFVNYVDPLYYLNVLHESNN